MVTGAAQNQADQWRQKNILFATGYTTTGACSWSELSLARRHIPGEGRGDGYVSPQRRVLKGPVRWNQ
jgi:hypothetical protein